MPAKFSCRSLGTEDLVSLGNLLIYVVIGTLALRSFHLQIILSKFCKSSLKTEKFTPSFLWNIWFKVGKLFCWQILMIPKYGAIASFQILVSFSNIYARKISNKIIPLWSLIFNRIIIPFYTKLPSKITKRKNFLSRRRKVVAQKVEENTKLTMWWWQLLLDHGFGNESVENGNESLKFRMLRLLFHFFSFTFFYDTEPFISDAPNCHFIFRYPQDVLSRIVSSSPPLSMCYKIIKNIKNDSRREKSRLLLHPGFILQFWASKRTKSTTTAEKATPRLRGMWCDNLTSHTFFSFFYNDEKFSTAYPGLFASTRKIAGTNKKH